MFNTEVGIINRLLISLEIGRIPWFQEPFWAMAALVLVNLWLGFPYMMTISLGALQSIPSELYEAAIVDGATRWQRFRRITLPLLMVSLAPLLVGSFAFNFNNFTLIFLLTGGGPSVPGEVGVAGATDILISYTYKLAFGGGRGIQYGFAAAVSIVIALIIGAISLINFRLAGTFEEVRMDV
jgi:ABC-type sugar transport system permease subunit